MTKALFQGVFSVNLGEQSLNHVAENVIEKVLKIVLALTVAVGIGTRNCNSQSSHRNNRQAGNDLFLLLSRHARILAQRELGSKFTRLTWLSRLPMLVTCCYKNVRGFAT